MSIKLNNIMYIHVCIYIIPYPFIINNVYKNIYYEQIFKYAENLNKLFNIENQFKKIKIVNLFVFK